MQCKYYLSTQFLPQIFILLIYINLQFKTETSTVFYKVNVKIMSPEDVITHLQCFSLPQPVVVTQQENRGFTTSLSASIPLCITHSHHIKPAYIINIDYTNTQSALSPPTHPYGLYRNRFFTWWIMNDDCNV